MQRMGIWLITFAVLSVSGVMAQEQKYEISTKFGYTLSEGVDVAQLPIAGTNQEAVRMSPESGFSWGLQFDYLAFDHVSFGFLWDQQYSKLVIATQDIQPTPPDVVSISAGDHAIANMKNYNYYGVVTYNLGSPDSKIRPFFFAGLGVVYYNPGELIQGTVSESGRSEPDSVTRFSSTWGAGIKAYLSPNVGVQMGVRWTPTHVSAQPVGFFCGSEWGCSVSVTNQYSNQFVMNGGMSFRF
jgi:opacity protein-like surface antigen